MGRDSVTKEQKVRPPISIENMALAKVVAPAVEKAISKTIDKGNHTVDFTVRIHGMITKGEDYTTTTPNTIPWATMAAILIDKTSKATGRAVEKVIEDLLVETVETEGVKVDQTAHDALKEDITRRADGIINRLVEKTEKPATGKVTAKLSVMVIPPVEETIVASKKVSAGKRLAEDLRKKLDAPSKTPVRTVTIKRKSSVKAKAKV